MAGADRRDALDHLPSVIIQQQVNSLSTRQIIPQGPDAFDFVWTHFGFADDTPR